MGSRHNLSIVSGPTSDFKPQLLHRLFERVVVEKCNHTALIFEDCEKIAKASYKELNEKSNKIARFIVETVRKQNLQRNSDGDFTIGVSMYPSDNLVVTLLAIWKSGAAYVPIDPAFPGPRIKHICKEVRPVIVIYDQDSDSFMNTTRMSFYDILDKSVEQSPDNIQESDTLKYLNDDLAIVMYTSGSTGVPKGVRLLHKAILNRLNWQFKTFPYSSTEKVGVFKTALTFVDSVSEIWGPLINGLAILVVKKITTKDPEKLVALLEKYKIERLVIVPSLLRSLLMYLELQKSGLNYLRFWICSGEPLVVSLAQEFYKVFPENSHKLLNFYGSTEIMGDVTYHIIEGLDQLKNQEKVPIGLPVDNTTIYLLDTNFQPVKVGDVGEICVSGLNLAAGYVNGSDPVKFIDNPLACNPKFAKLYRTGDYGKIEKGTILYVGRRDSQVKIRGHRVDLSEIEEAVNSLDEVERGIVLCYKPGEIHEALLTFVTTIALVSENKIEELLRKKLVSYMVPRVLLRKSIPLLESGKVDKQALFMSYETTNNNDDTCSQIEINYVGVPNDKMDSANALFETVASVLKKSARSAISVNANFYEIGGNSLNSIFTISALKEKGYHISIGDFIAAINFGDILERMTKESKSALTTAPSYTTEMLTDAHKPIVADMIATSLYYKGDLEQWLKPAISINDYTELIDGLWEPLLQKNLSFVAKNKDRKIEGIAINFDARDIPQVVINTKLIIVIDFFKALEAPFRDNNLPPGKGKILYSFKIGTHSSVTPKDNVAVVHFMEGEVLNLASKNKFSGVFATNTSPLTQQLATDVYGYRTLLDYQVNQYVAGDNTRPFEMAPNDQRAKTMREPNLSIIRGPTRNFKPQLLHRLFEQVVEEKCNDTALIHDDGKKIAKSTYRELNEKSNKIARFIVKTVQTQNLQRNSDGDYIIAVSMYSSEDLVITLLAIWKSGAAYLPIEPTFPASRVQHICREARPIIVIYDQDSDAFLNTVRMSFPDTLDNSAAESPTNLLVSETLKYINDDLATVLYTSGSTGVPKGVRLLHKVILNRLYWQFQTFPYSNTENVGVFKTSLTFVDSVSEIWGPLISGLAVLVVTKTITQNPEKLVALLETYKIERMALVPSLLRSLLQYLEHQNSKSALKYLRLWMCTGESLVVSLAQEFYNFFPENAQKLLNFYGSTEITDVTYHIIKGLDELKRQEKIPIGVPVDNTIIYVLDTSFQPVKVGDIGELYVSGVNLAAGYVNGGNSEKFIDNPFTNDPTFSKLYRTGDFGKIENGTILYEGRMDSQVKIRGYRVDLSEVEEAVNSLHEIVKGIVLCYKPGEVNQVLLTFVMTIGTVSENHIEELLRRKLPSYMVPQVIMRETIPLLVNGKVDRQALLKSYKSDDPCYQTGINFEGVPNDKMDVAKTLFETVATVLKRSARSAISANANFYKIGGNSLNSILTINSLKEKGYYISIGDFIAAMNFGEVIEKMTKERELSTADQRPRYTIEMLKHEHKPIVTDIITTSFYQKGDLERWLKPDISTNDYVELIDAIWEPVLEKNLSFVVKNDDGNIEGVVINFDARDIPQVQITSKLVIIFDFLKRIEGPIRDNELPPGKGSILNSFMIGTHSLLSHKDNVAIMHFIEGEIFNLATEKKFAGILTTNTSPLTQQLASDIYGFQTLLDYQVNQYVANDNAKPFGMAPNDQRVKVCLHMF